MKKGKPFDSRQQELNDPRYQGSGSVGKDDLYQSMNEGLISS